MRKNYNSLDNKKILLRMASDINVDTLLIALAITVFQICQFCFQRDDFVSIQGQEEFDAGQSRQFCSASRYPIGTRGGGGSGAFADNLDAHAVFSSRSASQSLIMD